MCNKNCRNYGINQTLFIIFQPNTFIWIVAALRWFSPIDCDLVHALCRRLILPYIFCCMYCWAVGFDFQGKMKIKWMSIKVWVSVNHILKLYAKRSIQIYKCQPKRKKKKTENSKPWKRIYRPYYERICGWHPYIIWLRLPWHCTIKKHTHYFWMSTANYPHTPSVLSAYTYRGWGSDRQRERERSFAPWYTLKNDWSPTNCTIHAV